MKVSICCLTYNQEQYIEDAIKGFICQKTNFEYEIIIHDDCSVDKTPLIIEEYAQKYPNLIKTIIQTRNQYSQGKNILNFCLQVATGEYVAICEGDDFWIDENKLQKQIDILDFNNNISACMHNVKWLNCKDGQVESKIIYNADKVVGSQDFLEGKVFPYNTCSLMIRKDAILNMPKWVYDCPVGDIPMQLYATMQGGIYFLKDEMAVYRYMANNSWTKKQKNNVDIHKRIIETLIMANEYSDKKYNEAFVYRISKEQLLISIEERNKKMFKQKNVQEAFKKETNRQRVSYWLQMYMPKTFWLLRKIWKKV